MQRLPLIGAALCTAVASATDPIVSTFDTDLEGWRVLPGATIVHAAGGGNAGGFARIDDAGVPDMTAISPRAFGPDLTRFTGGTISFDAKFVPVGPPTPGCLTTFGIITITGSAGVISRDIAAGCPSDDCWQRFDARFGPQAWGVDPVLWDAVLADVQSMTIRLEAVVHDEAVGIDNIAILPPGVSNTDLNGDGVNGVEDLLILLAAWGDCPVCCAADIDGDNVVGVGDLLALLAGWG